MGKFIIIRGPTGVGKTTFANALIAKLGQGYLLTLDEIRSDLFQAYLTCAMEYENIVGEMFFGFARTMYNVIGATREHQTLYSLCADCVYF